MGQPAPARHDSSKVGIPPHSGQHDASWATTSSLSLSPQVLWSLEAGHWIPEEPFEFHDHFPAAPVSLAVSLLVGHVVLGSSDG